MTCFVMRVSRTTVTVAVDYPDRARGELRTIMSILRLTEPLDMTLHFVSYVRCPWFRRKFNDNIITRQLAVPCPKVHAVTLENLTLCSFVPGELAVKLPSLRRVHVVRCGMDEIGNLGPVAPQVTCLDLQDVHRTYRGHILCRLLQQVPNITSLRVIWTDKPVYGLIRTVNSRITSDMVLMALNRAQMGAKLEHLDLPCAMQASLLKDLDLGSLVSLQLNSSLSSMVFKELLRLPKLKRVHVLDIHVFSDLSVFNRCV